VKLANFNYSYPESLIALKPLERRADSRMMLVKRQPLSFRKSFVKDLSEILNEDFVLVFNESPVIPSRFKAKKKSGGDLEGLLLHSLEAVSVRVWLQGKVQPGDSIQLAGSEEWIKILEKEDREVTLEIGLLEFQIYLQKFGLPGVPPYIRKVRKKMWGSEEWASDSERYQSILAKKTFGSDTSSSTGYSVAAPTASLHFDQDLLSSLAAKGVQRRFLKLDVGAGTFAPLEEKMLLQNRLHVERVEMSDDLFSELCDLKKKGKKVIAVGTTPVRALESAAIRRRSGLQLGSFETDIFIHPDREFNFQMVDGLFTNFHQPESSLLLLIARFMEPEAESIQHHWRQVYEFAVAEEFRLFSYGDAMLIL